MTCQLQFRGIVRARAVAAQSLVNTLKILNVGYSERDLADKWLMNLQSNETILPFGWYQPPPDGMSVLLGSPPNYSRLIYRSLREESNFPRPEVHYMPKSILYPYFSVIDRETLMIGDHVATYYAGYDSNVRDVMRQGYNLSRQVAEYARVGMSLSELYSFASELLAAMGGSNNNFSFSGGLASDIGHTIPFFGIPMPSLANTKESSKPLFISKLLSSNREFVSAQNPRKIENSFAFTIEPQVVIQGCPMVSFHMIIIFVDGNKFIVEKFRELFDFFEMSSWLYKSNNSLTELS